MADNPPDPPSHDETMIESSILEVPPPYSEPALPPRPVRKGPIVASLLLAVFSLAGGGFVLYRRSLDEREREFLALAQASLDAGDDPRAALKVAAELPGAVQSRVSVMSLTEQLEARVAELEARAEVEALLAGAPQDPDLEARGARLAQAAKLAPRSPLLGALSALHQLEVWARRPGAPKAGEWRALARRLSELPATPSVLVARARVALAANARDPGSRSDALGNLAQAGAAGAGAEDPSEERWAAYARAWRAVLAQEPSAARAPLEEASADPAGDPLTRSLVTSLGARVRWTQGDLTGAAAELERARRLDPLAEAPAVWTAWVRSEVGDAEEAATKEVAQRWPRSATAQAALAQVLARVELERARSQAQGAIERDRGSDLGHLVAARIALRQGRLEAAKGHATKAVLWGRSLAAHLLRIEIGLARRDSEFAQHDLRAARGLAGEDPRVEVWAGRVDLRAGRGEEALKRAEGLVERMPGWVEGRVLAARAYGALARWREASAAVEEAIRLDPESREARLARAEILVATNQSVLALADLEQLEGGALEGAMPAEVAYLRARAHRELGEVDRAKTAYRRFLKLAQPKDVRRRLAAGYVREGAR